MQKHVVVSLDYCLHLHLNGHSLAYCVNMNSCSKTAVQHEIQIYHLNYLIRLQVNKLCRLNKQKNLVIFW